MVSFDQLLRISGLKSRADGSIIHSGCFSFLDYDPDDKLLKGNQWWPCTDVSVGPRSILNSLTRSRFYAARAWKRECSRV